MEIEILPKKVNAVILLKNIFLYKFCIRIKQQISFETKN